MAAQCTAMFGTVSLVVMATVLAVCQADGTTYTTKWDNVDVEPILKNERLLKTYFRCLMDQGKCSPDAAELKKNIPDALESDCSKCSEKHREVIEKVMKHMFQKKQDMFKQLEKKYDPNGMYRAKYSEEAKMKGIEI